MPPRSLWWRRRELRRVSSATHGGISSPKFRVKVTTVTRRAACSTLILVSGSPCHVLVAAAWTYVLVFPTMAPGVAARTVVTPQPVHVDNRRSLPSPANPIRDVREDCFHRVWPLPGTLELQREPSLPAGVIQPHSVTHSVPHVLHAAVIRLLHGLARHLELASSPSMHLH